MPSQKSETSLAEFDFVSLRLLLLARNAAPNPTASGKLVLLARLEWLFLFFFCSSLLLFLLSLSRFFFCCLYDELSLSDPSSSETNSKYDGGCSADGEDGEGADGIEPKEPDGIEPKEPDGIEPKEPN